MIPRTSPFIVDNIPNASSPIQNDPASSQKRSFENSDEKNEEQDNEKQKKRKGSTTRVDIERNDENFQNYSSKFTSRLSGDPKSLAKDIDETEEQGANSKDSSFKQKNNENDTLTMISKTEFIEIMNETIEDESEKLLKTNCSDVE